MFSKYTFKQSIGWLMALIGLVFYAIGYYCKYINPAAFWTDIFIKIGDVLIIGVVVGYLTGVAQWSGIFKKEIQDIIYGKEFLNKRNDIESLWYNVTKQMFKFKFADIHKDLLATLRNTLPGEDDISYYEDYDADTKVEWVDPKSGLIKSIDTFAMYIVAESDKAFSYPIKSWTIANEQSSKTDYKETLNVCLDGITLNNLKSTQTRDGNEICSETNIPLQGKKRYFLQYTREKTYNINEDYYIGFKAKYLTKNLKVSLELPEDIEAVFIERGTSDEFKNVKNSKNHIKKVYKGVIFPKQGYIFALKRNLKEQRTIK